MLSYFLYPSFHYQFFSEVLVLPESSFPIFFENSVTLLWSSLFSQSTVLKQYSPPKPVFNILFRWPTTCVFFIGFFSAKVASFLILTLTLIIFLKKFLRICVLNFCFLFFLHNSQFLVHHFQQCFEEQPSIQYQFFCPSLNT